MDAIKPTERSWKDSPKHAAKIGRYFFTSVVAVITAFFFVRYTSLLFQRGPHLDQTRATVTMHTSCGESPETARARNCSFDLLSFSWLPQQCYDAELTSLFLERNWTWYRTRTLENSVTPEPIAVSQDVVAAGNETVLYVSYRYHIVHCIFMWRKLHRGLEIEHKGIESESAGAWIDSYTGSFGHTHHCSQFLLDWEDNVHNTDSNQISTRAIHEHNTGAGIGENLDLIKVTISTKYPTCPVVIWKRLPGHMIVLTAIYTTFLMSELAYWDYSTLSKCD